MAVPRTEAPTKVTHPRDEPERGAEGPANAIFDFGAAEDIGPELAIQTARPKTAGTTQTVQGIDLSGKKKIIFWVGRGKTGKTTGIRWSAEAALADGRSLLMADMDPTNDTFSRYMENVARPPEASDPAVSLKWLDRLLQHALQNGISLLVDLGGGDTTLRRLVTQLPDLVALFEAEGFAVVVFYTVGPQEEDLSPLATLEGLGFKPTASAIVLNEAMVEVGDARDTAFARIYRHSVFRAAIGRGAVPVWMPKLIPAQQVEVRRLHFRDAVAGQAGRGTAPLGPFDRTRAAAWLRAMEANFAGIETWLP